MAKDMDFPPCSRLFASIGPNFTEEEVRDAFGAYGDIEHLSIPRDKVKNGPRGYAFIKFKKTSEAAAAFEALDNTALGAEKNNIHIAVAGCRKEDGSNTSDVVPQRIIVTLPQFTELDEIRGLFSQYGDLVEITHVKSDRKKAILKFSKFSEAAYCYENCKNSYFPNFLLPKKKEKPEMPMPMTGQGGYKRNFDGGMMNPGMPMNRMMNSGSMAMPDYPNQGGCKLRVIFNPSLSKDNLVGIFNIIPGFLDVEYQEMTSQGAVGAVMYDNPQSAAHAVNRINGLEYPLGYKLEVMSCNQGIDPKISTLLNTIKEATNALKGTGINVQLNGVPELEEFGGGYGEGMGRGMGGGIGMGSRLGGNGRMGGMGGMGGVGGMGGMGGGRMGGGGMDSSLSAETQRRCSAHLPPSLPVLSPDHEVKQRLFFVIRDCNDHTAPELVTDLFCRFGNLINAHTLKGKKCGYARYASVESAEQCIKVLNGEKFNGGVMKVEKAEPEKYTKDYSKRPRMQEY